MQVMETDGKARHSGNVGLYSGMKRSIYRVNSDCCQFSGAATQSVDVNFRTVDFPTTVSQFSVTDLNSNDPIN